MAAEAGQTTSRVLNKLAHGLANKASDISTVATTDRIPIADASDDYEVKYATVAQIGALRAIVNVTDAATYTVLAADSGKTHIIPDLTASCTLTLPTAAAGLEYIFIGSAVAADAQNWVFDTGSAAAFFLGGTAFADTDAGAAADEIHAGVYSDGNSNDIFTVVTPGAGTRVHVVCDGTNWILNAVVFSATVPTLADT